MSSAEEFERFVFGTGLVNGKRIIGKFQRYRESRGQLGAAQRLGLASVATGTDYGFTHPAYSEAARAVARDFSEGSGSARHGDSQALGSG